MQIVDPITANLVLLVREHMDAQRARKASAQRLDIARANEVPMIIDTLETNTTLAKQREDNLVATIETCFAEHAMASWCEERPGLGAYSGAYITALLKNPWLFPGQCCNNADGRHYTPPILPEGAPCPFKCWNKEGTDTVPCPGFMEAPRPHSGVRSLWHFAGLHEVDGKMVRHRRGQQSDWNGELRTFMLKPQGPADQIRRRVSVVLPETEGEHGHAEPKYSAKQDGASRGYVETFVRTFHKKVAEGKTTSHAIRIARWRVAKDLLGDFLMEWKKRVPLEYKAAA